MNHHSECFLIMKITEDRFIVSSRQYKNEERLQHSFVSIILRLNEAHEFHIVLRQL